MTDMLRTSSPQQWPSLDERGGATPLLSTPAQQDKELIMETFFDFYSNWSAKDLITVEVRACSKTLHELSDGWPLSKTESCCNFVTGGVDEECFSRTATFTRGIIPRILRNLRHHLDYPTAFGLHVEIQNWMKSMPAYQQVSPPVKTWVEGVSTILGYATHLPTIHDRIMQWPIIPPTHHTEQSRNSLDLCRRFAERGLGIIVNPEFPGGSSGLCKRPLFFSALARYEADSLVTKNLDRAPFVSFFNEEFDLFLNEKGAVPLLNQHIAITPLAP